MRYISTMSASDLTVLGSGFFWGSFRVLLDSFGVSGFSLAARFPCLQDTLTNVPGKRKTFETEKQHESEICMATEMEMGGVRSSQEKEKKKTTAITTPLQFYGALSCSARKLNKKKRKESPIVTKVRTSLPQTLAGRWLCPTEMRV